MKNYAITVEGIDGEPEILGTYSGNTAREAFEKFVVEQPVFEGEAEVYEIGPGAKFIRHEGNTEERA